MEIPNVSVWPRADPTINGPSEAVLRRIVRHSHSGSLREVIGAVWAEVDLDTVVRDSRRADEAGRQHRVPLWGWM